MKILRISAIIAGFLAALFAGLILYAVVSDYRPPERTILSSAPEANTVTDTLEFSLLTWNIGYAGLDEAMDFFYDGGKKVVTPRTDCISNLNSVISFLKQNDYADFILLQEVDRKSRRSYRVDQFESVSEYLEVHSGSFATNYDVFFVPVPPLNPMGRVLSGIATFSRHEPFSSVRYSFPGTYGFPKQLFMLDRCFMVNRYHLQNGKELVLINTHNEAFDPGEIRKAQMAYLRQFVLDEYAKGNYVVAGGDWNQTPPGFVPAFPEYQVNTEQMAMEDDFLPDGWRWAHDNTVPSNRSVVAAFDPAVTPTTVIDFFLLSPNIDMTFLMCYDLGFKNSDHNPVLVKIRLAPLLNEL